MDILQANHLLEICDYNPDNIEFFKTTLENIANERNGNMTEENDQVTSKTQEPGVTTESPQFIITRLRKENSHLINQRNELLKILFQKDSIIERLSSDNKILETQFRTAVSQKIDALIRFTAVEGKELSLSLTEKPLEIGKEYDNNEITSHPVKLTKNRQLNDTSTTSEIFGEALGEELDADRQCSTGISNFQKLQDHSQEVIAAMKSSSEIPLPEMMDEEVHNDIERQQIENNEEMKCLSEITNARTNEEHVKQAETSELTSSVQVETPKRSHEDSDPSKNKRNRELDIDVDISSSSSQEDINIVIVDEHDNDCVLLDSVNNVKSNSPDIQLQLLSEVRTRQQIEFLRDAFRGVSNGPAKSVNAEPLGRKGRKVRVVDADIPKENKLQSEKRGRGRPRVGGKGRKTNGNRGNSGNTESGTSDQSRQDCFIKLDKI